MNRPTANRSNNSLNDMASLRDNNVNLMNQALMHEAAQNRRSVPNYSSSKVFPSSLYRPFSFFYSPSCYFSSSFLTSFSYFFLFVFLVIHLLPLLLISKITLSRYLVFDLLHSIKIASFSIIYFNSPKKSAKH